MKGYNVYYSEVSGGRFDRYTTQPVSNVPTYLVRKLKVGQRYYFKFTSVASDGTESAQSKEVSAVALPMTSMIQTTGASTVNPQTK